jgi:hypothetical protein
VVRDEEERVPLAGVARPVRGPRVRGHAPADAGRPRRIGVRTVPRPVPNRCGARARVASRRGARLGRARVQPPCRGSFGSRARDRPRSRRTCARRSRGTEAASGDRSVHGGCNCVVRLWRDDRGGRHERATHRGARSTRTGAGRSPAGHHRRRGRALARPPSPSPEWNQALMDLGREVCRPKPRCEACPIAVDCRARSRSRRSRIALRRAARFEGSMRQVRGGVVNFLRRRAASVDELAVQTGFPVERIVDAVGALVRDGLVVADAAARAGRTTGRVRLAD